MDKNAIKKYAVWARRELISRVSQKALQYGIAENEYADRNADSVNGKLLTAEEKHQRAALIEQINKNGYEQVMDAYHVALKEGYRFGTYGDAMLILDK